MDPDIPENFVAQLSGHKNLKSLDSYKSASTAHQRKMSLVLSRSTPPCCATGWCRDAPPYNPLTKIMEISPRIRTHDYDLRNDHSDQTLLPVMSDHFKNFVTRKYY